MTEVLERLMRKRPNVKRIFYTRSFFAALEDSRRETLFLKEHALALVATVDRLVSRLNEAPSSAHSPGTESMKHYP